MSVLSGGGQRENGDTQEGSSTESQSHMREALSVPNVPGAQYIDTVVESQYVLIEASPPADSPQEVCVCLFVCVYMHVCCMYVCL